MRVRRLRFLTNRCRAHRLAQIRTALVAPPPEQTPGSEPDAAMEARPCPVCRSGRLRVTGQLAPRGAFPRPPTRGIPQRE